MSASTWQKTHRRHLSLIAEVAPEPLPRILHITGNSKTGFSIDFPPHATCRPTKVCMGSGPGTAPCYALSGFMGLPNTVRMQARNQRLVDYLQTAPASEVDNVAYALMGSLPRSHTFLRWNGAGDLTFGACRVINALTLNYPEIALWVITRKVECLLRLDDRPSLHVTLSTDASTPSATLKAMRDACRVFKHAKVQLGYTRTHEADTPIEDAGVVFNNHAGGKRHSWAHPNVCPATLPDQRHEGTCAICRRCFT